MEIWEDIRNYEGQYQISNLGRVRTLSRTIKKIMYGGNEGQYYRKGKIMSIVVIQGYCKIGLRNNNWKQYFIHRLVAEAFIPNIENKPFINHINGNKKDNAVINLEWCTASENIRHRVDILGIKTQRGAKNKNSKPVIAIYPSGKSEIFPGRREASRALGIGQGNIVAVLRGAQKTAHGFKFINCDTEMDKLYGE